MADSDRPCPACSTPVPIDAVSCPSCGALSLPNATGAPRATRSLPLCPVATHVLLPELSRFLGLERFLREIHIAAQLNHPHILALHDSGEADGLLFYVMPFVEGDSLRRRLLREGPLPVAETVRIAAEVADGLAYAHQRGVVHRDIKPENILLTEQHAVIADFGIARAIHAMGGSSTITSTGISLGTPDYMSPEQATGDSAVDHRTDIYAFGCTLYEMLTGRPPYAGPTPQALIAQHLSDPVPSARALRREVPPAIDAAVRRAMAKAPADRFQGAAELAQALGGVPTGTGARARLRPVTPPWLRATLAVAAVAVVVGGAALLLRGRGGLPVEAAARTPLHVVVQPFRTRTPGLQPTADRVTEALTDLLQRVPALDVKAYVAVADLRDAPFDTLRARLAPDRIVVGSVEEQGTSLRAAAQIVDAVTGRSLAGGEVTVPRGAGPDSAARGLSGFVRLAFWDDIDRQQRRARVRNAVAWALVERAEEQAAAAERAVVLQVDQQGFRALDVSDSLLREARRLDGASDLVPIELAHNADRRAFYAEYLEQKLEHPPRDLPDGAAARTEAMALLDRLIRERRGPAEAFELRGQLKEGLYRASGADSLLASAIADYGSATELDLHRAGAWRLLGSALLSASQPAAALLAIDHAVDEDVFQLYRADLLRARFDAAMGAGRYDAAADACRSGAAEFRGDQRFTDCELQVWSRTRADRRTAALAVARAESLNARDTTGIFGRLRQLWTAAVLARAGLGDSADRWARQALARAPEAWLPVLLPEATFVRIQRHDLDSAVALAIAAARQGPTTRRFLRNAAEFQPLRADPRFAAAVRDSASAP